MNKSGLADSPFFAPQTKTEATPPSLTEPEVPTKEDNTNFEPQSPETPVETRPENAKKEIMNKQSIDQSTDQSTNRPINQSIKRPTTRFTDFDELGPVVEKPKAFYITQKVDRWLDESVRYLQDQGLHKVDRSILMNALLHKPELFGHDSLDMLRDQLLAHLTNKSLRRI